jgi:hypothetical protein
MQLGRVNFLTTSCSTLWSAAVLGIALNSCTPPTSSVAVEPSARSTQVNGAIAQVSPSPSSSSTLGTAIWSAGFADTNWIERWSVRKKGEWGLEQNAQAIADPSGRFSKVLRVRYPAGSASPRVSRKQKEPLGGAQFYADLGMPPKDSLRLSYYVRFSEDFDFVKGGKLPGLFGGKGNSGGKIPDGTDGFSTRFMWRRNGDGEVYAYLPTSSDDGSSIGRGTWRFQPGTWHHLEQEVVLNHPDKQDGRIQVWVDGVQVLDQRGLAFRATEDLKIEGIFFSTFFGGGSASWATPKDVYVDFADFSVSAVN